MQLKTAIEGYLIFKASRASAETIKTDRSQLHQFLDWEGNRAVGSIETQHIRAYLEHHRDRGLSPHK